MLQLITKKLAKFGFSFSLVLGARKKSAHQLEKLRQYQLIDVAKDFLCMAVNAKNLLVCALGLGIKIHVQV